MRLLMTGFAAGLLSANTFYVVTMKMMDGNPAGSAPMKIFLATLVGLVVTAAIVWITARRPRNLRELWSAGANEPRSEKR